MTTDGSNGVPEGGADDDPFAYLYRPADGSAAPSQPRSSYSRPMEVGRAQYGQQPAQAPRPQPSYGQQPAPHGTLPTAPLPQQSRYAERSRPRPGDERPSGGRGKGAVIGAVAVVAAVAVGVGIALSGGDPDGTSKASKGTHTSAPAAPSSAAPASPSASATTPSYSGSTLVVDSGTMTLSGGSRAATDVAGAKSAGGRYVDGMGTVGATASVDVTFATKGDYQIWVRFNNTGANANATVSVDGKPTFTPIKLNNYSPGLPAQNSWYQSWVSANSDAGRHTISVSCGQDNQCNFLLDQIAVTPAGSSKVAGW